MAKTKRWIIYLILIIIFYSCKTHLQNKILFKEIIVINNFNDTCIFLKSEKGDTMKFNRNIEIIENTFQDTINVGFNLLYPGQKSSIFLIQIDTSRTKALYSSPDYIKQINESKKPERLTNLLCIYNLSNDRTQLKTTNQKLIIRVKLEE